MEGGQKENNSIYNFQVTNSDRQPPDTIVMLASRSRCVVDATEALTPSMG
jgi:hypothetical protein